MDKITDKEWEVYRFMSQEGLAFGATMDRMGISRSELTALYKSLKAKHPDLLVSIQ